MIGYFFGCFLTAQLVAKYKTGKGADQIGSFNPGTANIGRQLGKKWALLTLAGDIMKTMLPIFLCRFVLFPDLGQIAVLYVGLGVALGHGFPFYRHFKGGKGVAVTCTYLILFFPFWGVAAGLLGFLVVIVSGYLTIGALLIPLFAAIPAFFFHGAEAGGLVLTGAALLFVLHRKAIPLLLASGEKKSNLFGKVRKGSSDKTK
jgi:glycerol-3-phosphate acyltransferase PlsY